MKDLDHHLLCPMQCHVNGVLIDKVPKFLVPIPSETTHDIHIENPFDATYPIIIPLKLSRVTSYFEVRKPTQEEYKDRNILKIELIVEASPWTHLALNIVARNRVWMTTGDGLSALPLQRGDNCFSTLLHFML